MTANTVGFEHYEPVSEETPVAVLAVSVGYVAVMLCFILCLLTTSRRERVSDEALNNDKLGLDDEDENDAGESQDLVGTSGDGIMKGQPSKEITHDSPPPKEQPQKVSSSTKGRSSSMASSGQAPSTAHTHLSSAITNAENEAETGEIEPRPLRSWDLMTNSTMRLRHGHFSAKSVQRLVQQEKHAQDGVVQEGSSYGSQSRGSSWNSRRTGFSQQGPSGGMSDQASQALETFNVEGEADFYRQRYLQKAAMQRHQQQQQLIQQQQAGGGVGDAPSTSRRYPSFLARRSNRAPSVISRTSSGRSRMPRLSPDVLAPEDAADAFDPGMSVGSDPLEDEEGVEMGFLAEFCSNLLDLAEPDGEARRIMFLTAPSTLGAIAEPCFRLGMVAIISHFIDIDSMIAFVLVILFVRVTTEELSGAISDAESSMLHQALTMGGEGGFTLAGRHIQLSVFMQFAFAIPVLILWAVAMDPVVSWLIPENERVAELAAEYTRIIVIDFGLQSASRCFLLVFHMTGQAQFELYVDLCATAVTIVAIALTATLANEPSLRWLGWIQVVIGIIKIGVKIGFIAIRGLLEPYWKGLFGSLAFTDGKAVWAFVGTTLPLLMGSLIELREWEILLLFVRHLGGGEVATWALMGIIWEIFEASTEGLGEAAAVRVSLLLSENLPELARLLAHKTVLLGMVLSMVVTGVFLMVGQNLSVALTQDMMIQNLFNDLVGTTGLANISMSLSQIYWSLLGSQGRFGLASSTILLCRWLMTMPLAAIYIFRPKFELAAVSSALAIGYMTSTAIMAWRLFHSDWELYARLSREEIDPGEDLEDVGLLDEDEEEDEEDDFDFDDSGSDSTGFG